MSSNSFIKQCAGKVKHKSLLGAEYAFANNSQNQNANIYKCKYCLDFHIGTRALQKKKTITKKQKGEDECKRKLRKVKKFRY